MSWTHESYCDALGAEIGRFADVVRGVALDTPVPTCGDWTLAQLVEHTGIVERWAAEMVRRRSTERLDRSRLDVPVPERAGDLADWFAAGADEVVSSFRAADPGAPMWAWGADKHARFWARRMLHETTVHRADAELALGREPQIETRVAIDGIDELLDNLPHAAYFRPHVAELRGDGESIHLHGTDVDEQAAGEWTIHLRPGGFTWDHGHGKATVAVRGPAADLLLLLYRRRPPVAGRYEVFGDDAVLAAWLDHSAL
ncbi:MAG TPA: maleylpyruvate isomerase family mycothiol-dependent enzyme [Acidimicrobiia bacterium]